VGWFTLICLIIQLVLDSAPRLTARQTGPRLDDLLSVEEQVREARSSGKVEKRLEIIAFCWLLFLLFGLVLMGFLVFIPIYVFSYLHFQASYKWVKAALYAAGTWLFVYLLFVRLFEIRLYAGILLERFFDF